MFLSLFLSLSLSLYLSHSSLSRSPYFYLSIFLFLFLSLSLFVKPLRTPLTISKFINEAIPKSILFVDGGGRGRPVGVCHLRDWCDCEVIHYSDRSLLDSRMSSRKMDDDWAMSHFIDDDDEEQKFLHTRAGFFSDNYISGFNKLAKTWYGCNGAHVRSTKERLMVRILLTKQSAFIG